MSSEGKQIQWWLAELGPHDLPKLIDGPHSHRKDVNRAAYLIRGIGLGPKDRKFAVARVELSACEPTDSGVNKSAFAGCKQMVDAVKGGQP